MLKKIFFLGAYAPFVLGVFAQTETVVSPTDYARTIRAEEMKEKMAVIASADFEGRETGEAGQKKCADYLVKFFKNIGIPPVNGSYVQSFPMREEKVSEHALRVNGISYTFLKDYFAFQGIPDGTYQSDEIVFVGFGINDSISGINEYAGFDVKDKIVAFFEDEPMNKEGYSFITGTTRISEWSSDLKLKTEAAKQAGAKAIISIQKHADNDIKMYSHYIQKPKTYGDGKYMKPAFPKFYVSEALADAFFRTVNKKYSSVYIKEQYRTGKRKKGFRIKVPLEASVKTEVRNITGENVLGYIEGTDLKDELVIITAHYDHLGKTDKGIFYGADDDGSGTVSLMEIAEAFMAAKKAGFGPRRSILIMPVSGEEKGLLGSEYYSEHPIFPLNQTVVDLNIDMIGRVDKFHEDNFNYVYIIGSDKLSSELHIVNEQTNTQFSHLEFDYKYNDENDPNRFYYRSDHYNFAKNGIPVIFYFTGVHADYHRMTDTPEKLHYEKMAKIAQHVFYTAWEIANRDGRLLVDKK